MCERCKGFLRRKPTGEVPAGKDERVPFGCVYWDCKRCGYQNVIENMPQVPPVPDDWQTIPF